MQGDCDPDPVTPYLQVDGGSWSTTNAVQISSGSSIKLGPQAGAGGTWQWSTGDATREITISNIQSSRTVTATYTSQCGAVSSLNFTISVNGGGLINGATYIITAQHSGKSMDVDGASTAAGANIFQWTTSGAANQQWTAEDAGSGYYKLKCVRSSLYMDVSDNSTMDGANVLQWTSASGQNQQFQIAAVGNGYYTIKARHSGKCIEVASGSTSNGANVQQWTCNEGTNQRWAFALLTAAADMAVTPGMEVSLEVETYPNPITDVLHVENAVTGDLICLYKSTGEPVLQEKVKQPGWDINMTLLDPGVYIMKIQGKETVTFKRIIKQ